MGWELQSDAKIDAARLWARLPAGIRPIVNKRLMGEALLATERAALPRWPSKEGYKLLLA